MQYNLLAALPPNLNNIKRIVPFIGKKIAKETFVYPIECYILMHYFSNKFVSLAYCQCVEEFFVWKFIKSTLKCTLRGAHSKYINKDDIQIEVLWFPSKTSINRIIHTTNGNTTFDDVHTTAEIKELWLEDSIEWIRFYVDAI